MRWAPQELLYELSQDAERRVLFVEGMRDLAFWRELVPSSTRPNGVIYPISFLECPNVEGGNRGRLLATASAFAATAGAGRVRFFADADADRVLQNEVPPNVFLTDGRDLESYGLSESCIDRICTIGFPSSDHRGKALLSAVTAVVRPVGILRIGTRKTGLNLPFRQSMELKGFGRFISDGENQPTLDIEYLIRVLIQNAGLSMTLCKKVSDMQREAEAAYVTTPDEQLVHGKDLLMFLAWWFKVDASQIERLFFLSLANEGSKIVDRPSILATRQWLFGR